MGRKVKAPRDWSALDVDDLTRLWRQTSVGGVQVRQKNRSEVVNTIATAVAHLLANTPRVMFGMAHQFATRTTSGADPIHTWTHYDGVNNDRTWTYRILAVPRSSGSNDAYAQRESDTGVQTAKSAGSVTSPDLSHVHLLEMQYERGAEADAVITEGLSTFNNFSFIDVRVQADPLPHLDLALHTAPVTDGAAPSFPVLANICEGLRSALHELISTALPVHFSWSAIGNSATPANTDATAIVTTATTLTNMIDGTSTSRTATSPGFSSHCQYGGRGPIGTANGTKIPVALGVYCDLNAPSTNPATIRFIGPDHVASNQQDLSITVAGTPGWFYSSSNLYLNSASATTDANTARNKIDPLAQVDTSGDTLYTYAMSGWEVWAL